MASLAPAPTDSLAFNESHVLATTQAICEYRQQHRVTGPLFIGHGTPPQSGLAFIAALGVLTTNRVEVRLEANGECTPAPAISRAIVTHNRCASARLADGIVVRPSQEPGADGGVTYTRPTGGPDTAVTRWIEDRATRLLSVDRSPLARIVYAKARRVKAAHVYDYIGSYVRDLASVVDMDAIRRSGLRIGVDPLGAAAPLWRAIADRYGVGVEAVNEAVDVAFGDDTGGNQHGIVTRATGLMHPEDYLAVAVGYLFTHRPGWRLSAAIGTTMTGSSLIDRVAAGLGRPVVEEPSGFTSLVPGLLDGSLGFAADERAAASFLQRDGAAWTTDTDGIVMDLLAAEIMARTGRDPSELYADLTRAHGTPVFERIDVRATAAERTRLATLSTKDVAASRLAGDAITAVRTAAVPCGGLKVATAYGWFAARPCGAAYALYAESFKGHAHLQRIQTEARAFLGRLLAGAGGRHDR